MAASRWPLRAPTAPRMRAALPRTAPCRRSAALPRGAAAAEIPRRLKSCSPSCVCHGRAEPALGPRPEGPGHPHFRADSLSRGALLDSLRLAHYVWVRSLDRMADPGRVIGETPAIAKIS